MASIFTTIGKTSSLINSLKGLVLAGDKTQISNLVIDCSRSEKIEYTNVITNHPVESKDSVSDHIFREFVSLTINGMITDSSMRIFGIIETPLQKNSLGSIIRNAKNLLPFNDSEKPSNAAFKVLESIRDNRELVTVVAKRKVFKNMAIEKLSIDDDEGTVHGLNFTCTFKQLAFATVRTTGYKRSKSQHQVQKQSDATLESPVDVGAFQIKNRETITLEPKEGFWDKVMKRGDSVADFFRLNPFKP